MNTEYKPRGVKRYINPLLLLVLLLFIYFSPLHSEYYFADETGYFTEVHKRNPWAFLQRGLRRGRPFSLLTYFSMGDIVNSFEHGLPIVRGIQFTASYGASLFLFYLLRKRNVSQRNAMLIVLFIWSQPALQVFHVYAMLTPYLFGMCLSFLAFLLLYTSEVNLSFRFFVRLAFSFVALLVAWVTFQASPFCGLAPLAFYLLSGTKQEWNASVRKCLAFIGVLILSMVTFIFAYQTVVHLSGEAEISRMTERTFLFLSGSTMDQYLRMLDPRNYLGPFEWWNYIYPVRRVSEGMLNLASALTLFSLIAISVASILLELKTESRRYVMQKYALAYFALLLTFIPLIAEGFSGRHHVYIAAVPAVSLVAWYCASICLTPFDVRKLAIAVRYSAMAMVLVVALGAQANVYRGLVMPNVHFLSFVRAEILRQMDKSQADSLLVISVPQYCEREPCSGYFGRRMGPADRRNRPTERFYKTIYRQNGGNAELAVQFGSTLPFEQDMDRTIIIDHRILRRALKGSAETHVIELPADPMSEPE